METVHIGRIRPGWSVMVVGVGETQARTLESATRAASQMISVNKGLPQHVAPGISWLFDDDFVNEARAVGSERAAHLRREDNLAAKTTVQVIKLSALGIGVRDIALLLGLTPGRVSQIAQTSSSMFFDSGNASDDIQLVKVQTADGWVEGHGRGALPESIDFAGTVYIRTGGSTSINGSAWKHTYARA